MEEGDHVPLTYAGLKRWLGLVLLVILAASLAWVLKPILLLFAIVILLAMVLNPIPFVFGQAMDLNPVSILFFTLAMSSLFGLTGRFSPCRLRRCLRSPLKNFISTGSS